MKQQGLLMKRRLAFPPYRFIGAPVVVGGLLVGHDTHDGWWLVKKQWWRLRGGDWAGGPGWDMSPRWKAAASPRMTGGAYVTLSIAPRARRAPPTFRSASASLGSRLGCSSASPRPRRPRPTSYASRPVCGIGEFHQGCTLVHGLRSGLNQQDEANAQFLPPAQSQGIIALRAQASAGQRSEESRIAGHQKKKAGVTRGKAGSSVEAP